MRHQMLFQSSPDPEAGRNRSCFVYMLNLLS